jgi:hypothetical protein
MRLPGTSRLILIAALQLPMLAGAQTEGTIYRTVDEQGRPVYSDRPSDDARSVKLPPVNTMKEVPPTPRTTTVQPLDSLVGYDVLTISEPTHDSLVRSNLGEIEVKAHIEPGLQGDHQLQLLLDGSVAGTADGGSWLLEGVTPGTHTLQLQIRDEDGQIIQSSDSTTVHLQRGGRKRPAPVPVPL